MKVFILAVLLCVCLTALNLYALEPVEKVSIYGCVTQGFMKTDANNYLLDSEEGSFQMREMLLTFSSQLAHNIRVGAQIAAIDLGDVGNNEPILDWAFGDVQFYDFLGVRAGRIKGGGIGFYNETQDIDVVRTGIFLPPAVYSPLLRDSHLAIDGLSAYGFIGLSAVGRLSYSFSVGTAPINKGGTTYKYIENFGVIKNFEITLGDTFLGSVIWLPPVEGLRIGVSYLSMKFEAIGAMELHPAWFQAFNAGDLISNYEIGIEDVQNLTMEKARALKVKKPMSLRIDPHEMMVYSFEYIVGNLTLASEIAASYNLQKVYLDGRKGTFEEENNPLGGYLSAAYRISEWFELGLCLGMYFEDRDDVDGKHQMAYYSSMKNNAIESIENTQLASYLNDKGLLDQIDVLFGEIAQPDFTAWQHMATITSRFDLNEDLVFKLEYSVVNGTALLSLQENLNLKEQKENWNIFAAKVIFVF